VKKYGSAGQATHDNIIWRMRFACWITKATDTQSEYAILIVLPRLQCLRERASMLRLHVHCVSCYNLHALCLLRATNEYLNLTNFKLSL
jgi:hypothetical protein